MKTLVKTVAVLAVLSAGAIDSADAARIRCGSSWEVCAQRGRGPHLKFQNRYESKLPTTCGVKKGCR